MLITKVKVNKVTNLSDARYCAGMGVDFLSFPAASVDPKTYQEITGWVAGPQFGIEAEPDHFEKTQLYRSDFIQFDVAHLHLLTTENNVVVNLEIASWKTEKSKLLARKGQISALEFNFASVTSAAVEAIQDASKDFEVFVKFNSSLDLPQLLQLPITGITLEGNSETKPGLKDYPFAEILERLEVVD
jgi:phosphoribosylanthranilate isomerase